MGHVRQLEPTLDERIMVTNKVLRSRYASSKTPLDLAMYIRSVSSPSFCNISIASEHATFFPIDTRRTFRDLVLITLDGMYTIL